MSKNKLYVLLIVSILITILIGCGQKSTYINDTYDGCGSSGNLLESFLKGKEKVYFEYYVPKEYFDDEFLFKSSDSMYLSDVINVYNRYYLVHAAVSDIEENIEYMYMDWGNKGKQELAVRCNFPGGGQAIFFIEPIDGKLQMMNISDGYYRSRTEVNDVCGIFSAGTKYSASEKGTHYEYINENGKTDTFFYEDDFFEFGREPNYEEPLAELAFNYRDAPEFAGKVVLKSYSFEEYDNDFTPEEQEKYYQNMIYTLEYVSEGDVSNTWHNDDMFAKESIFSKIFKEAGRKLYTPEEALEEVKKRAKILGIPDDIFPEGKIFFESADFTSMDQDDLNAVFRADMFDGKSEAAHALCAYQKSMKNPMFLQQIIRYSCDTKMGVLPGMLYGFTILDVDRDNVPELLVDFGPAEEPLMQEVLIYKLTEKGKVEIINKPLLGMGADGGIKNLPKDVRKAVPKDSFLFKKNMGPLIAGMSGDYFVTFINGVSDDYSRTMAWQDFVSGSIQFYTESLVKEPSDNSVKFAFTEDNVDDPDMILGRLEPIEFFEVNEKNISKILSVDYWEKNKDIRKKLLGDADEALDFLYKKSADYVKMKEAGFPNANNCCNYEDYYPDEVAPVYVTFDLGLLLQTGIKE